ncbi:partial Maltooligosyl trehalose synthase, partial [uncultured bacterium]
GELLGSPEDGRVKLFLTYMALNARRERFELFNSSSYIPLECEGAHAKNAVAFARAGEREAAVTIAPRFLTSLVREGEYATGGRWADTTVLLPKGLHGYEWKDALTGRSVLPGPGIKLRDALASFPAAFLLSPQVS